MPKIKGGYTDWARQTLESDIFKNKPDKWFKIWFYIVSKAMHKDNKYQKRGEFFTKYEWIMEATNCTRNEADHCIRWLKSATMIATQKAIRGMTIEVKKYDFYQDKKNYKSDTKSDGIGEVKAIQKRSKSEVKATLLNNNDKHNNNDKSSKESITKDTSTKEIYISIFEIWNKQGIIKHKKLTDEMKEAINGCLKNKANNKDEIIQAIKNYKRVWSSDKHWLKYSWTLIEFLRRGFEKCRDWESANRTYKNKEAEKPQGRGDARRVSTEFENGRTQI